MMPESPIPSDWDALCARLSLQVRGLIHWTWTDGAMGLISVSTANDVAQRDSVLIYTGKQLLHLKSAV